MTVTIDLRSPRRVQVGTVKGIALLAVAYYVAGRVGLALAGPRGDATLFLPAAGVALIALAAFGRRLWPGIALAVLALSLGDPRLPLLSSVSVAVGNTLEAVVGATLLWRITKLRLSRPVEVAAFVVVGIFGSTLIGATIGVSGLVANGIASPELFWSIWRPWWLGEAVGALIVSPVLVMLLLGAPEWSELLRRRDFWITNALLVVSVSISFFGSASGVRGVLLLLPSFPVLVWAAMELGTRGATISAFVVVAIATTGTVLQRGPFVSAHPSESTELLWAYSTLIGVTALALATLVDQRDSANRRNRTQQHEHTRIEKEKLLLLERERLTREMHDGLGGQLVSLLSIVERGVGTRSEVAEGLRRALDEIRIVIDSLDPNTTDLPTSLGKLRARLEPLLRRNGIELDWKVDDDPRLERFSAEAVLHLLRIVQECLTNTMRHAQAGRVEVRMSAPGDELEIAIHDDGKGFTLDAVSGGRGIQNMRQRAQELGTLLQLESAPAGTRIALSVPIPADLTKP